MGDHLAAAHHRDVVGHRHDLAQLMGDQHHRAALIAQIAQDPEQVLGFLRGQRAGRLIQDQDVRAAKQRLQDLDALLHRPAGRRPGVEIDLQAVFPLQIGDLAPRAPAPSASVMPPSAPSSRFSSTVNGSTSMKCWWTMPMPARIASSGLWIWRSWPFTG